MGESLPPATVFFDLDDTLFDHAASAVAGLETLRAQFPAFGRQRSDWLADTHAEILEALHGRVVAGELTLDAARVARFTSLCAACGAPELDAVALAETYREAYMRARRTVPGARELLSALRSHVRIGVITNNVLAEQVDKLRTLELDTLVDVLVVSEEVGLAKPNPAIFRVALERAGCTADRAVMLGDSWTVDMLGARAAGIPAIWFNRRGVPCPEPNACIEIASLLPTASVVQIVLDALTFRARRAPPAQ